MITSPPLPPSPPEGPPRGTYFSRRKAMQPFPPFPALTRIFASSINILGTLVIPSEARDLGVCWRRPHSLPRHEPISLVYGLRPAQKRKASSRRRGSVARVPTPAIADKVSELLRNLHR